MKRLNTGRQNNLSHNVLAGSRYDLHFNGNAARLIPLNRGRIDLRLRATEPAQCIGKREAE